MAMYHSKAADLKDEVAAANFSAAQLTTISKMMKGCTMLRQTKVIESFLSCMLPENLEIAHGDEVEGKYGTYRPSFIQEVSN
jgi:hypothetical protein